MLSNENNDAEGEVAIRDFLRANGVAESQDLRDQLFGCFVVKLGAPQRDAAWCTKSKGPMKGSAGTGESMFPLEVWAPAPSQGSARTMRLVLQIPLSAGALDLFEPPAPDDPDEGRYVALAATLSKDGKSIVVAEKPAPARRCADAMKVSDNAKMRKMVETACRSIGTYTWRGDRFVR